MMNPNFYQFFSFKFRNILQKSVIFNSDNSNIQLPASVKLDN